MDGTGVSIGMAVLNTTIDGESDGLSVVASNGMAVGDANDGVSSVGLDLVGDVVGIAVVNNVIDGEAEGLEVG